MGALLPGLGPMPGDGMGAEPVGVGGATLGGLAASRVRASSSSRDFPLGQNAMVSKGWSGAGVVSLSMESREKVVAVPNKHTSLP